MLNLFNKIFKKSNTTIHTKIYDLNIITFGSCLARRVASEYSKLYNGRIISSVYHNRSDAFVGKFITKNWNIDSFDNILEKLVIPLDTVNRDNNCHNILRNQFEEHIGLHKLKYGIPLFKALSREKIDYIFIDNFVDLRARLLCFSDGKIKKNGFFLRTADLKDKKYVKSVAARLTPIESLKNFYMIIDFFRSIQPNTKIIFLNFPINTRLQDEEYVDNAKKFEENFYHKDCFMIEKIDVLPTEETHEWQHYKKEYYNKIAKKVHSITNQEIKKNILVEAA